PDVQYAEPNYWGHVDDVFPNDPMFQQLWGMHNIGQTGGTPDADIDAPEAWEFETGDEVLLGVIDTGVDVTHEDLADNIYINPNEIPDNGIDDDDNGFIDDVHGWDFVYNDNNPDDQYGHGTHVSGTIAGIGNNEIGVTGVCWTAKILPIRWLDAGGWGTVAQAVASIEYATLMGAKATNNSWGFGPQYIQSLRDAIEAAGVAGSIFVASAGNDYTDTDLVPHYPSSYLLDNIISVAATDHDDLKAGFSNWGLTSVDLGAPGVGVLSTVPGNQYYSASGTSMSAPHVAGAVGLLYSIAPTMNHLEVKEAIMASADSIPSMTGRTVSGGRLNIFNMLSGLDSIPPARVNDLMVVEMGSNTARLDWIAVGDDDVDGQARRYDLRYSTSQIYWSNWDSAIPVSGLPAPRPSGTPESFQVTGLDFETDYYFGLVVVDEQDNHSFLSNLPGGTTLGVPALQYTPSSFSDDLFTGETSYHTLTISNTAAGTLDFVFPNGASLPSWVRAEPPSGRVYAGESVDVQIVFDAFDLPTGVYTHGLVFETNDPLHPMVTLSTELTVTSAPDIAVSPDTLDYGLGFIGTSATKTLIVANVGREPLVVSGVSTDNTDYTTDPSGFVLAIGQSRNLTVTFSPTSVGDIFGTLSIASNDPDFPVKTAALVGLGAEPPVISVAPPALRDTLYTGQQSTHMLTISNSGGWDLIFELAVRDAASVSVLRDDFIREKDERRQYAPAGMAGNRFGYVELVEVGKGEEDPRDYPEMELASGGPDPFGYSWKDNNEPGGPVFNWVDVSGGSSIYMSDDDFVTGIPLGFTFNYYGTDFTEIGVGSNGWMSFTGVNGWFPGSVPAVDDFEGAIAPFALDLYPPSGNYVRYQTIGTEPARQFVIEFNNVPDYGGGNYKTFEVIFYERSNTIVFQYLVAPNTPAGFGIESPDQTMGMGNGGSDDLFISPALVRDGYAIEFSLLPDWIALDPTTGTVPPGENRTVAVTMDAMGLVGADYGAAVLVSSNDPVTPELEVPADLHVICAPDIAVSADTLDFGPTFVNGSATLTLGVSNPGCEVLEVTNIATDNADFTASVTSVTLSPGAGQDVDVTFAPTSLGTIAGTLTLTTNDPDESSVVVLLQGEGLEPPVIGVVPDSLSEELLTGAMSTQILTISNTGGNDLEFGIAVRDVPGAAVSMRTVARSGPSTDPRSAMAPASAGSGELGPDETAGQRFNILGGVATPPPGVIFEDDFEDGNFDDWQDAGGSSIKEVTDETAANGTTYSYHEYN
ncbi:MAG: S8 family serine peptidase, partial [Candidatus Latescibacterota bacterium]